MLLLLLKDNGSFVEIERRWLGQQRCSSNWMSMILLMEREDGYGIWLVLRKMEVLLIDDDKVKSAVAVAGMMITIKEFWFLCISIIFFFYFLFPFYLFSSLNFLFFSFFLFYFCKQKSSGDDTEIDNCGEGFFFQFWYQILQDKSQKLGFVVVVFGKLKNN